MQPHSLVSDKVDLYILFFSGKKSMVQRWKGGGVGGV